MRCNSESLCLEGRVAVVTGAASGIGFGCARFLSEMGASVALFDVDGEKGAAAAAELGPKARFVKVDVRSEESCRKGVAEAKRAFGRIDALVNCAGVIRRRTVVDLTEAEWDLVLDVGLKGIFLVSKFVVPIMAEQGGGGIVNIGSGWGVKGGPKAVAYCAAKGGTVNMTRAMAIDHGPQNIRVNCVCPGDVDTPLLRDEGRQLGMDPQKWLAESADRPIHRVGQPLDIAKAVYFLVSDLSPWVSGSIVVVDGGGTA
jgi:NAD(P)-dependent dehydrogenase (short-subunit alcohol dehydrogenase family)